MKPERLKEDKNFLEYPNWVLDKKSEIKSFLIEKDSGKFEIKTTADRLPDRTDKLILYYFLSLVFQNNFKDKLSLTRYQIVKNVFDCKGVPYYYKRVLTSIQRWHEISIKFDGIFFDGENYTTRGFHIIESYSFDHKSGEINIKFNSDYLDQLKHSDYYQIIHFNKIKRLKRDVSFMLYELLIKQKLPWKIKLLTLAKKLTLKKKYDSQIIEKLIPAINEINKNTELKLIFSHQKNNHGEAMAIFEEETVIKSRSLLTSNLQIPTKIIELLPESKRTNKNYELINSYLEQGFDCVYIESNIKYSKINSTKNFSLYLSKALKLDYARSFREENQIKTHVEKEKRQLELFNRKEEEEKNKFSEDSKNFISSLSEEKYKEYEIIAIDHLIKEWKDQGFHEVATPEKLPKPCIKEKIYELFGAKS